HQRAVTTNQTTENKIITSRLKNQGQRMRAYGAPTWQLMPRRLGPDDGADNESTQGSDEDDRGPLRAGGQGRQGADS
ncbi:hypothetical protein, partial [Mycobacterium helveticum]|uniref:hypothetical protein n=1 Tax=Mycobacterium helveticum TaxID=2592811 RepID=UPI001AEF51DA